MNQKPRRTITIVGIGPGDPELITVKGARLIREADVVSAPIGDNSDKSVAIGIVEPYLDKSLNAEQTVETLLFPMKKNPDDLEPYWQDAAKRLAAHIEAGKNVVFITLGDPLLYSTSWYLVERLQNMMPELVTEFIPGVTSVTAAAAGANMPLSFGSDRVAIIPATFEAKEIGETLDQFETVVLMKVARVFDKVRTLTDERGLSDSSVYVRRIGHPEQKVIKGLGNVSKDDLDYLSLVIVRK